MAEDLRRLAGWFAQKHFPQVACPECGSGHLVLKNLVATPGAARKAYFDQTGDPYDLEGVFTGLLVCAIHTCGEPVVVAGRFVTDPDHEDTGNSGWGDLFKVGFTCPPLKIIMFPSATPPKVAAAIESAASVLWSEPSSAANWLRIAVEELLTHYGMRRFVIRKHRRVRLSTHERIVEFRSYEYSVAETLEAVKWIGNAGSHEGDLSVDDVLTGAELLGYALKLLYDDSDEQIERRVRAINKSKGLPAKRKRRGA